jgi:hypothetical protein
VGQLANSGLILTQTHEINNCVGTTVRDH